MINLFKFVLIKLFNKNLSKYKFKILDIIIIYGLLITIYVFENDESSHLDPIYRSIENYEKSYKKSFILIFCWKWSDKNKKILE